MNAREASLIDMGLNPDEFAESKIDPTQFKWADWPNSFKDLGAPCHPCAMCGHLIRWAVGFRHLPSGELILVGEDCSQYLDSNSMIEKQMKQFKTKVANQKAKEDAELTRIKRLTQFTADYPEVVQFLYKTEYQEVEYREAPKPTSIKAPMPFMNEMVHAFNKWGSLTPGQTAAVQKIMKAQAEFEAKKASQPQPAQPLMGGKRLLEGEVVSVKWQTDGYYGPTKKMVVLLRDGNRVFGTVPKSITNVEKGQNVSLFGNVMVSKNDENFGFYSHPSKAVIERVG